VEKEQVAEPMAEQRDDPINGDDDGKERAFLRGLKLLSYTEDENSEADGAEAGVKVKCSLETTIYTTHFEFRFDDFWPLVMTDIFIREELVDAADRAELVHQLHGIINQIAEELRTDLVPQARAPASTSRSQDQAARGLAAQMQQAAAAGSRSRTGTEGAAGTGSASTVPVPAPASGGAGRPATPIQLGDLQSILSNLSIHPVLSNIQVPPSGEAVGARGSGVFTVDLSAALIGLALQPLLSQEDFFDKVKAVLPAGQEEGKEITAADLKGKVLLPKFQQALSMFSIALQSGLIAPLAREFGLGEEAVAAATQGDMGAFVKAFEKDKATRDGDGKEDRD